MDIEQFFKEADQDFIRKAKRYKDNNVKINGEDLENVYDLIYKGDGLKKLREDSLDMVAGGKSGFKVVDAEAVCSEFVADSAYYEKGTLDYCCCARCIHKVIAPKTIFFKERMACEIRRGKGYKSPSSIIN